MKKAIQQHLPDNFAELLKGRETAKERLAMLVGKREEAEDRMSAMKADLEKLDGELAMAVNQGIDTGVIMRKIRTTRGAIEDQGRLIELSGAAVINAEHSLSTANKTLSDTLQRAVMEGRNVVAERLKGKIAEIENAIDEWGLTVYEMADSLGLPAPVSGSGIILDGLR